MGARELRARKCASFILIQSHESRGSRGRGRADGRSSRLQSFQSVSRGSVSAAPAAHRRDWIEFRESVITTTPNNGARVVHTHTVCGLLSSGAKSHPIRSDGLGLYPPPPLSSRGPTLFFLSACSPPALRAIFSGRASRRGYMISKGYGLRHRVGTRHVQEAAPVMAPVAPGLG